MSKIITGVLFCWLTLFLVPSCTVHKPYYNREAANWQQNTPPPANQLAYSIFLIGDVGAPAKNPLEPSLNLLRAQLQAAGEKSAVVFLGDNIYSYGLTEPGSPGRKTDEERIRTQLDILQGYRGEKYMIPGNHDWAQGRPGGLQSVIRQEVYVEEYLKDSTFVSGGNFFVPDEGCPGPYEVFLQENLVLIALNSQWWLQTEERPYGPNNYCNVADEAEVLVQLEDIINRNSGKNIMVVGHHPLQSNGVHGGNFRVLDHIFPLLELNPYLFIPMPVVGSIYPWARRYGGISQDISYPKYQAYANGLMEIFKKYPNVVYAAGHEHNLQHFKNGNVHTIVSGSGCKTQYLKLGGGNAQFGHEAKGYAIVNYYTNGESWLEFWEPQGNGNQGQLMYRTKLYQQQDAAPLKPVENVVARPSFKDSSITIAANPKLYGAGQTKQFLLGTHYRQEWATPVKMPLLDLQTEQNGLIPYRLGGGKQTASLRLRNEAGREFSLRSVNKNPAQILPSSMRQTLVRDVLQDQISAQHPYGALILPVLAEAASVYHVNPKLVYVPDDPLLGKYLENFKNQVAILEENPDEDHRNVASLGYAKNLVGTDKVLERKQQDNDNTVDEVSFARARLFDMLIGDWDRHEGQWRWVERKGDGERIFEPVPKDRDVVFFKADGFIPYLITRKWAVRNIQNFDYTYKDYIGLNLTAQSADRTFLASVTKEQWLAEAEKIKKNVTDAVIEQAVAQWPAEIAKLSGAEIAAKLKSRRDLLPQLAAVYYAFLARTVDVAGSDKRERFIVNRLNNDQTQVIVNNIRKNGTIGRLVYDRTFNTNETKEIRLYGLGGDDVFKVNGQVQKGIRVRIIGGSDCDSITDNSVVSGLVRKTLVYDTKAGNYFNFGPETKNETKNYKEVNRYDRTEQQTPYIGPRLSFAYNPDDKFFIGAGLIYRTHKFRKEPYATEHRVGANYSFARAAYNVRYDGDFKAVFSQYDVGLQAYVYGPQLLYNFFGEGNKTPADLDQVKDYRVRFSRLYFSPTINKNIFSFLKFGIGPQYDHFRIDSAASGQQARQLVQTNAEVQGAFDKNDYLGLRLFLNLEAVSNPVNPYIGIKFLNEVSFNRELGRNQLRYTNVNSQVVFYLTPDFPFQLTWAGRLGAAHNFGDYRFYQANTLGGTTNLRGFNRTRFAGRSTVYANAEARIQLFRFNLYLFPGKFGTLLFYDTGRVFADNDASNKLFRGLHYGYGVGAWVDILNKAVFSGTYSIGGEAHYFNLTYGFLF
ncbi:metallophosphoesterase [Adhaeribacter swui]|uniref:Metallophosphoesterase n=1 Tax=Adhaeribacter swui TaxID=2086471 RepID=A0A7G7G3F2_9BACT|nr:metallophosphoesterase [Adhaeribacter swui]QNF31686.1 metallophosphoesterase [Adhaeribacter swui]